VLLVNGTLDPLNPYHGGRVTVFGFGYRGTVLSAPDSAAYFVRLLGENVHQDGPVVVVPAEPERATWVERTAWTSPSGEVELCTVHGGGHVVPQPRYRFPRLLRPTEMRFSAPAECWAFFERVCRRHED
jgi:polyhydroxybutyrate depolymerase